MILLDTDVLIEIFDKRSDKGDEALSRIVDSGQDVVTTSINLHEILYGLRKYAQPVRDVLLLPVLHYTKRDAELSSEMEVQTEDIGKPIRRTDTMIAAIAINRGANLYTFDLKHFQTLHKFGLKLFPK